MFSDIICNNKQQLSPDSTDHLAICFNRNDSTSLLIMVNRCHKFVCIALGIVQEISVALQSLHCIHMNSDASSFSNFMYASFKFNLYSDICIPTFSI